MKPWVDVWGDVDDGKLVRPERLLIDKIHSFYRDPEYKDITRVRTGDPAHNHDEFFYQGSFDELTSIVEQWYASR